MSIAAWRIQHMSAPATSRNMRSYAPRTVIVNEQDPVFSAASVALQLTAVLPSAKAVPLAGEHDGVSAPFTLSLALAVNVAMVVASPASVDCVNDEGHVTTGASMSAREITSEANKRTQAKLKR